LQELRQSSARRFIRGACNRKRLLGMTVAGRNRGIQRGPAFMNSSEWQDAM
jgi:hypothetical protein